MPNPKALLALSMKGGGGKTTTAIGLAELGQECHRRVTEVLPEIAARYRSIGKMRGEVRRLLQSQLEEIDALVKGLL